ncbi:MAG TPA: hypothetical protein VGE21_08755 [Flavobacteriales bacterium]
MAKAKRPADLNKRAKSIVDIAIGEGSEGLKDDRDPAAVALGKKGGAARAKSLTAKQRSAIAKKAAQKRWKKKE